MQKAEIGKNKLLKRLQNKRNGWSSLLKKHVGVAEEGSTLSQQDNTPDTVDQLDETGSENEGSNVSLLSEVNDEMDLSLERNSMMGRTLVLRESGNLNNKGHVLQNQDKIRSALLHNG